MNQRTYNWVSGVLWLVIAAAHALRIAMQWWVVVGRWAVRVRYSAIPVVIGLYLAFTAFRLLKKPAVS